MTGLLQKKRHLNSFQIIILSFASAILIGTLLLMLPVSSRNGQVTPFNQALFTATSAVCVTGLVLVDTAGYWTGFGQSIILILIQTGGMGVVTVAVFVALMSGKKISLKQRSTMQESIAAPKMGGIVRLTGFIFKTTVFLELLGAFLMLPVFVKGFGMRGIWMAIFHSVSAFCNAGFDLMGTMESPFVSLTAYRGNLVINLVVMVLILVGGIGFLTWDDIRTKRHHFKEYRMQSKVIFVTTGILLIIPAIYFYFFEFKGLPLGERILSSLFQSVTPRTAGFNTAELREISGAGQCMIILLMLIGGSPGSTAGGMKTTTAAVLFANVVSVFRRKESIHLFGRRLEEGVIKNAATILLMYLTLFLVGAWGISLVENLPLGDCLFETASAIGTVGLTLGITSELGILSQGILVGLMFFGRVGGLTLIYAAITGNRKNLAKLPQEKITVG